MSVYVSNIILEAMADHVKCTKEEINIYLSAKSQSSVKIPRKSEPVRKCLRH